MVNLLTQTVASTWETETHKFPHWEAKYLVSLKATHTFNLAVHPCLSALKKPWHMPTRRDVFFKIHSIVCGKKQP